MPVAPTSAKNNAIRGLELREQYKRGGTIIGVTRANQLKNNEDLSIDTINRMISFFARHEGNYNKFKGQKRPDGGPYNVEIAWLLWGGSSARTWAISTANKNDKDMSKKQVMSFECKFDVKDQETDYFTVSGYGSTFNNVDRVNDIVLPNAFAKSLAKRKPMLLFGHDMKSVPIGKIDEIKEDDKGLQFTARMPKDDAFVRDRLIPQIKIGSLNSFSIGYKTNDYEIDKKSGARKLKEVDLYEISLVTFPANEKAVVTSYKSVDPELDLPFADRETEWDSDKAVANIKEYTNSIDKPSDDYSDYFFYYDEKAEDNFTAYKLPFVDIIDGEPYIIPKAIFAIAGALQGARGGLNVPAQDRQAIIDKINQVYVKMAENFDDETINSPLLKKDIDLHNIDSIRTFEKAIASKFSNQEAKMLVAKAKEILQRDVEIKDEREAQLICELKLQTALLQIKNI